MTSSQSGFQMFSRNPDEDVRPPYVMISISTHIESSAHSNGTTLAMVYKGQHEIGIVLEPNFLLFYAVLYKTIKDCLMQSFS